MKRDKSVNEVDKIPKLETKKANPKIPLLPIIIICAILLCITYIRKSDIKSNNNINFGGYENKIKAS